MTMQGAESMYHPIHLTALLLFLLKNVHKFVILYS